MESLVKLLMCVCLGVKFLEPAYAETVLQFTVGSTPKYPRIFLSEFPSLTVTVKLFLNESSLDRFEEKISVVAPKNHGVMAYIKELHLRVFWKQPSEGFAYPVCKDYIQFRKPKDPDPVQVCREIDSHDPRFQPTTVLGPRVFLDHEGYTNVSVFTDFYSLIPNKIKLLGEIVFTAYSECWNQVVNRGTLRCSQTNSFSCISSTLFCDGSVNCAFEDNFGRDEMNCTEMELSTVLTEELIPVESAGVSENMTKYFIPTALILFIIWGLITSIRRCYKCYKADMEKEEIDLYFG